MVPERYSCDGADESPPLSWSEVPEGTRTFTLVMDDPDAPKGTWVHWVAFNLPAPVRGLPERSSTSDSLPQGTVEGTNGWGRRGYGGPCPPSGIHRYRFRLFALDTELELDESATAPDIARAAAGHVLAQAILWGSYGSR